MKAKGSELSKHTVDDLMGLYFKRSWPCRESTLLAGVGRRNDRQTPSASLRIEPPEQSKNEKILVERQPDDARSDLSPFEIAALRSG
jgi:hypothetical protein